MKPKPILLVIFAALLVLVYFNLRIKIGDAANTVDPTFVPQTSIKVAVEKVNHDSRFKFVYIVGVEGNGHHLMISILSHLPQFFNRKEESQIKIRVKLNDAWAISTFPWQKRQHLKDYREMMTSYEQRVLGNGTFTHYYEDTSFPYLNPRNALRRWDLVEMVKETQHFADLKILVIYRDPIAATYSALSRNFTHSVVEQSRIVEDNLLYIQSHLQRLDRRFYRTVQYEELLERPNDFAQPLANFLELPVEDIRVGLGSVRKNPEKWRTGLKEDEIEYLIDFFDESRRSLWPIFYDPMYKLLNNNKPS